VFLTDAPIKQGAQGDNAARLCEEACVADQTLTREMLHALIWATPMKTAAARLGLSANGLAKICDRLLVPYPTRGHWTKAAANRAAPPLGEVGSDVGPAVIAERRAGSRRPRTRLAPEARADQLLDVAMAVAVKEGIGAVSMKRIAREAGVSEALAFTYFSGRSELLAAVARRELAAMAAYQRAEIARGDSAASRVRLSTVAYLRQIEARGSSLHLLLSAPEVRLALRPERQARTGGPVTTRLNERYGVPADFAHAATQALTAASRRAGRLVATGKISRAAAERLLLAMVEQGNRDLVGAANPLLTRVAGEVSRGA
jgi:AcrR family transcriptional regulator